jgi:hypothetical protein
MEQVVDCLRLLTRTLQHLALFAQPRPPPRQLESGESSVQVPLLIHVIAGVLALVAGAVALSAAKGATLHRKSGIVFVYAMLTMSVIGGSSGAAPHPGSAHASSAAGDSGPVVLNRPSVASVPSAGNQFPRARSSSHPGSLRRQRGAVGIAEFPAAPSPAGPRNFSMSAARARASASPSSISLAM